MREAPFAPSENDRATLRIVVGDIERDLACLASQASPAAHQAALGALTASWARLVGLMTLGLAPQTRECPRCGASAMRDATRCGSCWSALAAGLPQ
jgi:hypothetical protein